MGSQLVAKGDSAQRDPAPGELASSAAGVAALAAERAAEAERARQLDPDVAKAIAEAGFARHFVPRECGGNAGTFAELTSAVAIVGQACAPSAWCASLYANLARMAGFLPAEGYREIWADGPDALVVGSLTPSGKAVAADGGWQVSGSWPYISGVAHSDWALVCAVADGDPLVFAVPRAQYRTTDTWFNVGMQATGSNLVTVEDVFVPRRRAFRREDLFSGKAADSTEDCHRVPLQAANGLSFAVPVLGAAQGALAAWSAYVEGKVRAYAEKPVGPPPNRSVLDQTLARCSGEIDAARLLLERASATADLGAEVSGLETMRNLRDSALAVEVLVTAVNRLFKTAGTSGQSSANPLQRAWRDVNSASTHIALQFEAAATAYSGALLDLTTLRS